MTYRVEFTGAARRDIAKLPERVACAVLEFCAGPLARNPHRVGRPLIGDLTGLHSARRGEYRVIYAIHDDTVLVEVAYLQRRSDLRRPR
ncbi:type II toxin-antitoxin system RelE/ParE family toxin [Phytohabitans sp. ZYX-F-186]|uniref:Type II toxin-antitoxin system RelE/ParE family toxin n=1 Tax=Phytohabitans maris TaxID=3071409 RepID=A0ABU0ZHQ6_9ACTN|nr:type II toxin-antitoxin system RelE/ParE family toxin [Phytohabitans sp. ZYX-F-186]MDQ7906567.1 type II toxin-antitoxin system RelE/ParE family toxin [Phytohabitans sp. ZYX-F-186]